MKKRGGDGPKPRSLAEREAHFWRKVRTGAPTECWEWQAGKFKSGYGAFCFVAPNKNVLAHRMAYMFAAGQTEYPPAEAVIMHTCDNRLCCNPRHLRAGTHNDNVQDMVAKGRMSYVRPRGTQQALAKLDDDKVREIRASSLGKTKLARLYGVSPSVIVAVRVRRTWRHVP